MKRTFLLLLLVPALAGCLSDGPESTDSTDAADLPGVDWVVDALLSGVDGHDHRDWTQHVGLSTPNFQELAHDPLGIPGFGNVTAGGHFCGGATTTEDGRRLSVISSFDTNVAFSIVDATDPLKPVHLGDYVLDFAQTYDVDMTPDGKHVVIAANAPLEGQQGAPGGDASAADAADATDALDLLDQDLVTIKPSFRDACTGEVRAGPDQTVAAGPSTIMVNIEDPANPVFEDIMPAPVLGPHSVSTADLDGTTYVASSITNLVHQASYFQFFEVVDLPAGGSKLVEVSTVDSGTYGELQTTALNGHVDAEMAMHPVTGQPVVYLSDWGGGLIVLDFSIPQAPTLLGTWADPLPQGGAMHSTLSLPGVHDGRHYILAGQEFIAHPVNRPSGWIYILDDTDPTDIKEVGRWTLPEDTELDWGGVELYSTHYFRVVDETVFVAMYHGGVWAFQLDFENPENMALPPTLGAFVPDQGPQDGRDPTGFYDLAPFVLDLFAYDDYSLVVYDGLSGVYTVQFDPENPMPAPTPWPREGIEV